MAKICPNCNQQNRDIAKFCGRCGSQLPTIVHKPRVHKAPGKSRLAELGKSLGVGASLFPTALAGGVVGGAGLTFIGVYLYLGISFGDDIGGGGLLSIVLTMVLLSPLLVPLSTLAAIAGGVVGLVMGAILGGAGFLVSILTTWMPKAMRFLIIVVTMTVVGAVGANLGYAQISHEPGGAQTWAILGGAVFGLVLGLFGASAAVAD